MNGRHATLLERFFNRQVEIRGIDADEDVRRIGQQTLFQAVANARDFPIVFEHLDITAHRQFFEGIPGIEPLPLHFWAANAVKKSIGQTRLEGLDQMTRQQVAGRFAGNHGDAHDTAGSHRMMPRRETARKSRIG